MPIDVRGAIRNLQQGGSPVPKNGGTVKNAGKSASSAKRNIAPVSPTNMPNGANVPRGYVLPITPATAVPVGESARMYRPVTGYEGMQNDGVPNAAGDWVRPVANDVGAIANAAATGAK